MAFFPNEFELPTELLQIEEKHCVAENIYDMPYHYEISLLSVPYQVYTQSCNHNVRFSDVSFIALWKNSAEYCHCGSSTPIPCEECRSFFEWRDGTPMSWLNWRDRKPTSSECGSMFPDGQWSTDSCSESHYYFCQRSRFETQ